MRQYGMMVVLLPLLAGGCVRSAAHLAALPVRSTEQVIDWTTTSREEAYRNERRAEDRDYYRHERRYACDYRDRCDGPRESRIYFDRRFFE